jgi:hypothetical protein
MYSEEETDVAALIFVPPAEEAKAVLFDCAILYRGRFSNNHNFGTVRSMLCCSTYAPRTS